MLISHIATEFAPIAKAGGLGDVVAGLSRACAEKGEAVEVILPHYAFLPDYAPLEEEFHIFEEGKPRPFTVQKGSMNNVTLYFIEYQPYFGRQNIYGEPDDTERFIFFCVAALQFLYERGDPIDVLHLHDWPAALAALLYNEVYALHHLYIGKTLLTIHNLEHQGKCPEESLTRIGLSNQLDPLRDPVNPRLINLLKAGLLNVSQATTVSPTYAQEIQHTDKGCNLQNIVHNRVIGILNGIDTDYWNPATDPHIPVHYDLHNIAKKKKNRSALSKQLGLQESTQPLFIAICRLVPQKGPDAIAKAIHHILENNAQFVLLGTPDPETAKLFTPFKNSPNFFAKYTFDEPLAHLAYAAADFILIPSTFEPCGLSQLIAMRYGTIPIARKTGGLADTVVHGKNGYVFESPTDLLPTIDRALTHGPSPSLIEEGMRADHSWATSAAKYLHLYR